MFEFINILRFSLIFEFIAAESATISTQLSFVLILPLVVIGLKCTHVSYQYMSVLLLAERALLGDYKCRIKSLKTQYFIASRSVVP